MLFNYSKLEGRIRQYYQTEEKFALAMGMGRSSLSAKLNNKSDFTRKQMLRAAELLEIEPAEIPIYFFRLKVQENERIIEKTALLS